MTIHEVKSIHLNHFPDSPFFDRKTLRFFGQRMTDFAVRSIGEGLFEVAYDIFRPNEDGPGRVYVATRRRIFDSKTGELQLPGSWDEK